MKNIAMRITYDGTNYHGWQRQKNGITVQQVVEDALSALLGKPVQVTGCSRTDAGVHALDYVLNFYADPNIPVEKFPYALNYRLPDDISALEAWEVDGKFHARFSAAGKRYIYQIWNGRIRSPFVRKYSWYLPYRLDRTAMVKAAPCFEGTHDFAGFMAAGGDQKTTVRTVRHCRVSLDAEQPERLSVAVEADAFLYNMVRIIAGTLADVGLGKIAAEELPEIIQSCDRTRGGITAPPEGLFLKKVYFNPEDEGR